MTRDEITALAASLAIDTHSADTLATYVHDVLRAFALRPEPQLVTTVIKAITSGTATYSFETDMLRILYAIMHDELLSPTFESALEAYSKTWQADTGTPVAFTQDNLTARTYRLYPEPTVTSSALIPVHGEPYGEDFPSNSLILIYADDREADIPSIYALPFAFDALSREFSYPSDHIDGEFAAVCMNIAQLFYALLGAQ